MKPSKLSETTVPCVTDPDEISKRYESWAKNQKALGMWKYSAPEYAAKLIWHHFAYSRPNILVFGNCGLIARRALEKRGGAVVDTICTLDELGGIEKDSYDAVVSTGTFVCKGDAPGVFTELVRLTKQGGLILFTLGQGELDSEYVDTIDLLEKQGKWKHVRTSKESCVKDGKIPCRLHRFMVL